MSEDYHKEKEKSKIKKNEKKKKILLKKKNLDSGPKYSRRISPKNTFNPIRSEINRWQSETSSRTFHFPVSFSLPLFSKKAQKKFKLRIKLLGLFR